MTESNNVYPYRALFETLLNYEADVMKTRLKCEGDEEDTALNDTNPATAGANTGLKAREAKFNNSKVVRLIGRLHSDLCHQEKLIAPGLKLDVQLVPARPPFFIKPAAPADSAVQVLYNYHIVSTRFLIHFKELSESLVKSHKEIVMAENKKYIIPHTKVSMKKLNIPSGGTSYTFDNVFKGKLPDRIALAMVADAAATGSYTANPFNFQNFGLNYIALSANSQMIPRIALEPNIATQDYLRENLSVMEAMGYDTGPYTWAITPTQWATGHNWVFKVTPDPIGGLHSKQLNGAISLG